MTATTDQGTSLLRMAAPLVVSFVMRAAFSLVDTAFAAYKIGDAGVAAIGLTWPFEFLMIALWVGVSTGLTSALSRSIGARAGSKIDQYLASSWRIVIVASPLFALIGVGIWFWAPTLAAEAGREVAGRISAETAEQFRIYGTVLIIGSAATSFWSIIPDSLVKAHEDTKATMIAGLYSNIINVVLNTVFVFVFEWGMFGIAFSTVLGRVGGLAYALHRAAHHERRRKEAGETPNTELDASPYRTILALAIPSSVAFVLMSTEIAVINWMLARTPHPTESIAAFSIYSRVLLFAIQPVIATAVAMLPYAARRFGSDDIAGVRKGIRQAGLASLLYAVVLLAPSMLLGGEWLALKLAETPVSRQYTAFALQLVPLGCLAGAPFLLCRPIFEGMNRGTPGMVIAALRYIVLTAPLAWGGMVLAERLGHTAFSGLLIGLLIAAVVPSVAFYLWLQAALSRQLAPATR